MNRRALLLMLLIMIALVPAAAQPKQPPAGKPAAQIDLCTQAGVALVNGQWRYSDARIVQVNPKTHDIEPKAGAADFDDSKWEVLDPTTLPQPRGPGRLCFAWYRIKLTIPQKVGDFDTTGATVTLETVVDDYGEIWVDGKFPLQLDQDGGNVVNGWNAVNRVVLTRDARPGQQIQVAIFGINAPLSNPPDNFIFIRWARLDFHPPAPK